MRDLKNTLFSHEHVVDWHEHVWLNDRRELDLYNCDSLVRAAETVGINIMVCSQPLFSSRGEPDDTQRSNNAVYQAMCRYPGKIKGMCFVDSCFTEFAIREIKRCVLELGMIGVKLYNQHFINDPVQFPIIELCIDLNIPVLVHAGKLNHRPEAQPNVSDGTHFASIASRYPEVNMIMAHIGGGGDWQWSIKAIAGYKNIVTDISGGIIDNGMIEESVYHLGADRVLFGTDSSVSASVGKILGANITEEEKLTILRGDAYSDFLSGGIKK